MFMKSGLGESSKRWNRNSKAGKFLLEGLKSGEIDHNETPKNVWERYPMFKDYKLESFRSQWNKCKSELGVHVRGNEPKRGQQKASFLGDEGKLTIWLFYQATLLLINNLLLLLDSEDDGEEADILGFAAVAGTPKKRKGSSGAVLSTTGEEWRPLTHVFHWSDFAGRDRMTVLVLMPSGVVEDFKFQVVDEGTYLEVTMFWPLAVYDVDELFKPVAGDYKGRDSKSQNHLLKVAAIRKELTKIVNNRDNMMSSKYRFPLPYQCTGETEGMLLKGRTEASYILSVDLMVQAKEALGVKFGNGLLHT